MNKEITKAQKRPSAGFPCCTKCTLVPAQGHRAQGNCFSPHPRTLSTAVLAQTSVKYPKHHASASANSRIFSGNGDLPLRSWSQQPHSYRRSISHTGSMCLSAQTAGVHSLEERKETVVWCTSKKSFNSN